MDNELNERYPGTLRLLKDALDAVLDVFAQVGIGLTEIEAGRIASLLSHTLIEQFPLAPDVLELIKKRAAQ